MPLIEKLTFESSITFAGQGQVNKIVVFGHEGRDLNTSITGQPPPLAASCGPRPRSRKLLYSTI